MNYSVSAGIQCPFFKHETKNLLCCEGFVEGTCMTTAFKNRSSALQYISENCEKIDGGSCPMAINLFEKYRKIQEAEEKAEKDWRETISRIRNTKHTGSNFLESRTTVN